MLSILDSQYELGNLIRYLVPLTFPPPVSASLKEVSLGLAPISNIR
jgi:hypothetical protein